MEQNPEAELPGPRRATWDDCVAALRAGLPPLSLLNLPSDHEHDEGRRTDQTGAPGETRTGAHGDGSEVPPTANLYHRFTGLEGLQPQTLQMVYLRPPFSLWDHIDATRRSERSVSLGILDSEMEFDLRRLFRPRFVEPPEFKIEDAGMGSEKDAAMSAGDISSMDGQEELRKAGDSDELSGIADHYGGATITEDEMESIADRLTSFLRNDDALELNALHSETTRLSRWQWSFVYGRLASKLGMNPPLALKLMNHFGSYALGLFMLVSGVRHVACAARDDDEGDIEGLVYAAVTQVQDGGWTWFKLADSMEAGTIGACSDPHTARIDLAICLAMCE
jgi:hypothetical protein